MQEIWVELIGATMTMLNVIYSVLEKWITWIWASLSALFYLYIYWSAGLLASAEIQVIYLLLSIYGLFRWRLKTATEVPKEQIKSGNKYFNFLTFLGVLILTALLFFINNSTNSNENLILYDSLLVAAAITAQYLMTKKYISCWILWIFVNIGYLPILYLQGLWISFGLYIFLLFFTFKGAQVWYHKLKA